jgi:tetratricopeptide (TPR) repeat protein
VLQQEWVAGAAILDDVLQEKPKAWIARSDRAFIHLCLGQLDDAIRGFQTVVERDPFLVESNACLGWALAASGQREAALTNARAAVERLPSMSVIAGMHAYAATILGRHDEAVAAANRAVGLSDRNPLELTILATTLHRAGDRVTAEAIYQELTSQKIYCPSCVAPAALTVVGPEECLKYLEQAHATKCYLLPIFLLDPLLEPVRSQSRFEALVAAVRRNHDSSTNSNSVIPPMKLRPIGTLTHD